MGNGLNKVLPDLYLGNFKDARDREQLTRNNITHILSIHDSAAPILPGMTYLCISAADLPTQNLRMHFKQSIMFIHESRLKGEGCLVHCLAGVSRSVTLVVAYIMTVTGLGWQEALAAVRVARPCAGPNLGFQRQLQEFETNHADQVNTEGDRGRIDGKMSFLEENGSSIKSYLSLKRNVLKFQCSRFISISNHFRVTSRFRVTVKYLTVIVFN
uniref:Dual specificity phosphatase 22b n=1 Tax=Oncorhynchus tshawytscha TaxID=74940 RepID=A0AAZ3SA85_ONCTS